MDELHDVDARGKNEKELKKNDSKIFSQFRLGYDYRQQPMIRKLVPTLNTQSRFYSSWENCQCRKTQLSHRIRPLILQGYENHTSLSCSGKRLFSYGCAWRRSSISQSTHMLVMCLTLQMLPRISDIKSRKPIISSR